MNTLPRGLCIAFCAAFSVLFILAAVVYWPRAAGFLAIFAAVLLLPVPPWQALLVRCFKKIKPVVIGLVALAVFVSAPTPPEVPHTTPSPSLPTRTSTTTLLTTTTTAPQSDVRYVLNTSSKKFHLPSCASAAKIKAENRREYEGDRTKLIEDGYSPCGNCVP